MLIAYFVWDVESTQKSPNWFLFFWRDEEIDGGSIVELVPVMKGSAGPKINSCKKEHRMNDWKTGKYNSFTTTFCNSSSQQEANYQCNP